MLPKYKIIDALVLRDFKCDNIRDVNQRHILQRKVFIASSLGLSIGGYGFRWGVNGCYSKDLTECLWDITEDEIKSCEDYEFKDDVLRVINAVNNLDTEWYDLIAGVAYFYNRHNDCDYIRDKIRSHVGNFSEEEIQSAYDLYSNMGMTGKTFCFGDL